MRAFSLTLIAWSIAIVAGAQTAPRPPQSASAAPSTPPPAGPVAAENYTYNPEGRRDPFVNLLGTGVEPKVTSRRGDGSAGLAVSDISVRGVMESRGSLIAMVQGADNHTYILHQGDRLADGTIKSITPQGLVIIQDVNDPLSLIKQRETRKLLRSIEDAKQ